MSNIGRVRRNFIIETFCLLLSIIGKINFLQLARYGTKNELTYRKQFAKSFDFMEFNRHLLEECYIKETAPLWLDLKYSQ
ncbi:hypothetical protein K4L44_10715 [Halosquirtibacter laminarini]|uniref:Uncharacterized protein n=1 Tax=Halosquirtibacter laminarini TaxID=3374600 RepID=A0AC61NC21_9BACT|nr:hypothetical protein K4L44_10715 [Prolixibacteraceae bacterium]